MPAATTPVTVSRALPGSTARVIRRGDEVLGSCEWVTTAWAGVSGKGSRRSARSTAGRSPWPSVPCCCT